MASSSSSRPSKMRRRASVALLLAALAFALVGTNGTTAQSASDGRPTVGLVNEDLAAMFNNGEYRFGTSFVDRISKDSEYNWVVVSRAVAEKAYRDGSVDAVLYIPQSFSRDILTLQKLSPTKATVEYKLEPQIDERADRLLEGKVLEIVHGFNQSVIKMYYASLADNMAEADGHMYATLGNQEALVKALTAKVQEPFSLEVPSIESFMNSATSLKDVNGSTIEATNNFTKSATQSLQSNGEELSGQLPTIEEYTKRQKEIAAINADNGNKGIANQATSDLDAYTTQFEKLKTGSACRLSGVDASDVPETCMDKDGKIPPHVNQRITELEKAIGDYTTNNSQAVNTLYTGLQTRIKNLKAIKLLLTTHPGPSEDAARPTAPPEGSIPTVDPKITERLQTEILALEATRDSLASSLPGPAFETELKNLKDSNGEALKFLKETSLTSSAVGNLQVSDWTKYDPDSLGLYVDNSNELHTGLTGLIGGMAEASKQITGGVSTVPDNSDLFDALLKQSATTSSGAKSVLGDINSLVKTGNGGLKENHDYYLNFSTILANTRTQGADTSRIYEFFSAPIAAKNITPEGSAVSSMVDTAKTTFDMKSAAMFGGGLLAGALLIVVSGLARRRRKTA